MLTKRIIPCLDVKDGQTVKGVNFNNLRYAGDPVSLAKKYSQEGADELVFLDITATNDGRKTMLDVVERVAKEVFIPFTVGGGIRTIEDIRALLLAGADKISLNTAAVVNPSLIKEASSHFGSQCVVIAVDAKRIDGDFYVVTNAGQKKTDKKVSDWIKEIEDLGAGEILLTSMDADGTQKGFDLELTALVSENTNLPVIASGGAGPDPQHFVDVFTKGKADAALAASIFHYGTLPVPDLKIALKNQNINVR
ncbi:MAG: imidazole glycerol phosphate synthase subunit HisF [Alphaproteobacteria bacterium]|nr:imidazole glycerol phosphate synthase subunit HisF [Alphaproteobacteria bacterium]MBO4644356.1 imidazole glycerol phosphate synthase subunit HisF [Alphaproteobacteria bacterium]